MCGIFGYIGNKDALGVSVQGLEQLEYRGYDSSGIAGIVDQRLVFWKKAGKLSNLKKTLHPQRLDLAIGHTRWATHGKVNDLNAHPHLVGSVALVHNGIIENYDSLKITLEEKGVVFHSETDTEVIAALINFHYQGDLLQAVQKALPLLKGIYALVIIHKDHPTQIIAAAQDCPLAIGIDDPKTETIIASDPNAFWGASFNLLFLQGGEIADVRKGSVEIHHPTKGKMDKKTERLEGRQTVPSKEGFQHFMLKEIYEQPKTIQKAIFGRVKEGRLGFEPFGFEEATLKEFKRVWFLGCGTSANAGEIGSMYLEEIAGLPASCDIASEARYRTALLSPDTLTCAISQSGETADTLAAMKEVKARHGKVVAFCNVRNSTIPRESLGLIDLKAGPEMSVCSTKAFTSQITVLLLFALYMAQIRGVNQEKVAQILAGLQQIPSHIEAVLKDAPRLEKLAKKYARYNDFFFLGRRSMYITAKEAALKLKEISYVNANGYPAGELKHGPIALLDEKFPVVAFCANEMTKEKILSSLMEVKARGAPLLAFAPQNMEEVEKVADDVFWLPPTIDELAPFASTVAGQLFAYYVAKERGCDIDQPRNLAKSVTVE
ncbi:MAG TPA: glutamine--fructose-6-phosphate transaminase (isomerizing) [Chlamydiales bacterium]